MSNLTNSSITQISIKRLSGKAMTNGNDTIGQEPFGSFIQQVNSTIFATPLPNNPSQNQSIIQSASGQPEGNGSVIFAEFDLVPIGTQYQNSSGVDSVSSLAEQLVFGADIGDIDTGNTLTYHAYALQLTSNFEDSASVAGFGGRAATTVSLGNDPFSNGFISTGSNQFQLVPEYVSTLTDGNPYKPIVLDYQGISITTNDAISYYLDTAAGILFIQNPTSVALANEAGNPQKVRAFLYVGQYQDEISGGDTGEGFPFSGDAVITGSLLVSGSSPTVTVTGSVEVTNGITGSLYGTASFATGLVPELFEIPEIASTGSGLVVSSSNLPFPTHNAIKIGNTELVDFTNGYFMINIASNIGLVWSGSAGGIAQLGQNDFRFKRNTAYNNFISDVDKFEIYREETQNTNTKVFSVQRTGSAAGDTFISGGLQLPNLPEEDSLSRVITIDNSGNLAYTSSLYFATATSFQTVLGVAGVNSTAISDLTAQTSSYITEAETGSMLEPYLLSSQTSSGFNELVIDNGSNGGDLTVNGNLYVYGNATELQVSKLNVEDRFILLNSGSVGGTHEGGIIVQTNANGSGSAIFYEQSTNRWMVAQSSSVGANDSNITVAGTTDYIVTVSASAGSPVGAPPNFGNGNDNVSVGQMYVNLTDHDIYIYA